VNEIRYIVGAIINTFGGVRVATPHSATARTYIITISFFVFLKIFLARRCEPFIYVN